MSRDCGVAVAVHDVPTQYMAHLHIPDGGILVPHGPPELVQRTINNFDVHITASDITNLSWLVLSISWDYTTEAHPAATA